MTSDPWLEQGYYQALVQHCFPTEELRREYEGTLRLLHEIPFYWSIWSDVNRSHDAIDFRNSIVSEIPGAVTQVDAQWLATWMNSAPSVLEVLVGIARRWSFFHEQDADIFFTHLFVNLGLRRYKGKKLTPSAYDKIRHIIDIWLSRQFESNGTGSPFPINVETNIDYSQIDIWGQMSAYSVEHF